MEQTKTSGRTLADAFVETISNIRLMALLLTGVLVVFLVVINDSEPGSTIEIFGLKYQRAKPRENKPVEPPETLGYNLPQAEILSAEQKTALPILDGSLALEPRRLLGNSISGAYLLGPNLSKITVGSRRIDGKVTELFRSSNEAAQLELGEGTYVEIEYRGQFFSLTIESASEKTIKVSLKQIYRPTLDLVPVSQLQQATSGD